MNINEIYENETGFIAYKLSVLGRKLYRDNYVEWLEKQLIIRKKNMEIKEAIQILKSHNEWRREDSEGINERLKMTDPKKLGIAIDTVVGGFKTLEDLENHSTGDLTFIPATKERVNVYFKNEIYGFCDYKTYYKLTTF